MTLMYCGGAASVMNFAKREFAILFKYFFLGVSRATREREAIR
jgi:hypothetical protein